MLFLIAIIVQIYVVLETDLLVNVSECVCDHLLRVQVSKYEINDGGVRNSGRAGDYSTTFGNS